MESLTVQCQACGQTVRIPAEHAGQQGRCRQCGATVTAPGLPTPAPAPAGNPLGRAVVYGFGGCLGVGIAAALVFTVLAAMGTSRAVKAVPAVGPEGITPEEFTAIAIGMDYPTVWRTVGGPGQVESDMSFSAGTRFASAHSIYRWKAESGFGNASVSFKDGQVSSKTQFGL